MNDKELYDYKDVFGHLPAGYNDTLTFNNMVEEKLILKERFQFTDTLLKDLGENPFKVSKAMKIMIGFLYLGSLVGVYIQAADIIPGLPDIWAGGFTIALLIVANAILWRQLVKDRADYAVRLAQMQQEHQASREKQQEAMLRIVEANKAAIKEQQAAIFRIIDSNKASLKEILIHLKNKE